MDLNKKKESIFLKTIPYLDKYGILILLFLMVLALHIMQPDVFLSWRNITNIFKQISWQSMLALGVFMVIVTAGIDLHLFISFTFTCDLKKFKHSFMKNCRKRFVFL